MIRRWSVVALAAWSLFVWGTRINNVWSDASASVATRVSATVLSVSLLVLAAISATVCVRARHRRLGGGERSVLGAFAVSTIVVWVVRGVQITTADYSGDAAIANPAGFKVVHLVLGAISLVLAGFVLRVVARDRSGSLERPAGTEPISTPAGAGR